MQEITLIMDGKDELKVIVNADEHYEFSGTVAGITRDEKTFTIFGMLKEEVTDDGTD